MVTTFLGREDDISEAVEQIQVRAILFHTVQSKAFKIPAHVLGLVEVVCRCLCGAGPPWWTEL